MFTQLSSAIGSRGVALGGAKRTVPRIGLACGLVLLIPLFMFCSAAMAQGGPIVQHTDPYWQATYWNNVTLTGTPAMQRAEPNLDWDWSSGSPGSGVNNDQFSARWTRYIDIPAGSYRFYATSDDGIRVWVDNKLIIDQWHDHPVLTYKADVSLSASHHEVRVEYYENSGIPG